MNYKKEDFFEKVIVSSVEELIEEYNQKEGYSASLHKEATLDNPDDPWENVIGILVKCPDRTQKKIALHQSLGGEVYTIGLEGEEMVESFNYMEVDKTYIKEELKNIIENYKRIKYLQ